MICNRVKEGQCASTLCPQGKPHEQNAFCWHGFCRQSEESTYCVPESKREQVIAILDAYLCGDENIANIAETIERIYEEGKDEQ